MKMPFGRMLIVRALGGASLAAGMAMALAPTAQAQEAAVKVNIAPGPLAAALNAFANATGYQLLYPSELVQEKASPGVKGTVSVSEGLSRLLAGTGLTARTLSGRTIQIEAASADADGERVTGAVRVQGTQDDSGPYYGPPARGEGIAQLGGVRGGQEQEAQGYRAKVATAGNGSPVAIEDIPRSVTVMTQDQIEKQHIDNIGDALERLPGITVVQGIAALSEVGYATVLSRGYEINKIQIDGGPARDINIVGSGLLNLDSYERVELLRGPNGVFAGAGSPGGSINLVRKRPGMAPSTNIIAEAGSWGNYRLSVDQSVPSLFGSPIAFRSVVSYRKAGAFYDHFDENDVTLYGIFDAPLGDKARLEWGAQFSKIDVNGGNIGQPRSLDGPLLPVSRDFNMVPDDAYDNQKTFELFSKLYVDLLKNWDFEFGTSFVTQKIDRLSMYSEYFTFKSDGTFLPIYSWQPNGLLETTVYNDSSKQFGIDAKLTGKFKTLFLNHNFYASLNYNVKTGSPWNIWVQRTAVAKIASLNDLLHPVYMPVDPGINKHLVRAGTLTNSSIVIGDTISWHDLVDLTVSLTRDMNDTSSYSVVRQPFSGKISDIGGANLLNYNAPARGSWRPNWSLAIKPTKNLTIYGSASDGFQRQDNMYRRSGEAGNYSYTTLDPSKYNNLEIGVKYGTGRMLATVDAYKIVQTDVGQAISGLRECPPDHDLVTGNYSSACFALGGLTQTSKGIDVELSGEIVKGLSVIGSFNYNTNETTGSNVPFERRSPAESGSLFIDWRPSFLPAAGFQLGLRHRGKISIQGYRQLYDNATPPNLIFSQAFDINEPAYNVFDVGADYQITDNFKAGLFVENVTDKTYLQTVSSNTMYGSYYGNPRSVKLSLTWSRRGPMPANGMSPTTGLAPFGDPSSWYAAFDAGTHMTRDLDATATGKAQDNVTPVRWTFQTKDKEAFALRMGYRFSDHLRSEIEGAYRKSDFGKIGGGKVAPFGVCDSRQSDYATPFNCNDAPGEVENWTLMLNVLYDIGKEGATIRPFIGGGAGLSFSSVDFAGKMDGIGLSTPWVRDFGDFHTTDNRRLRKESIGGDSALLSLGWQAIAGVAVKLSDQAKLDLTYRYVNTPKLKWDSYNLDEVSDQGDVPLTPRVGTFSSNYGSSMFTIGFRYAFGKRPN